MRSEGWSVKGEEGWTGERLKSWKVCYVEYFPSSFGILVRTGEEWADWDCMPNGWGLGWGVNKWGVKCEGWGELNGWMVEKLSGLFQKKAIRNRPILSKSCHSEGVKRPKNPFAYPEDPSAFRTRSKRVRLTPFTLCSCASGWRWVPEINSGWQWKTKWGVN